MRGLSILVFVAAALTTTLPATAGGLPNPQLTPGAINEALDAQALQAHCHHKDWTRPYRPPVSFTNRLKRQQMREYGYQDLDPHDYEEDHLIPLCQSPKRTGKQEQRNQSE